MREDPVRPSYMLPAKDAVNNMKYGIGIAVDAAIAYWLLSAGSTWLAGILFAGAALAMLIGLVWYWIWFTQRRAAVWCLAGVTLLVGIGLLSAGSWFGTESLALWGLSVVVLPLVGLLLYGAWRLVRLLITRLFQVRLIAILQVGAAWRGELLDR
jgi:hypothetical protein